MNKLIIGDIKNKIFSLIEKRSLNNLDAADFNLTYLRYVSKKMIDDLFSNVEVNNSWKEAEIMVNNLKLPEMTGGVNKGDQRAIFYLINYFKPKMVLEIGTHIGCSTIHITASLRENLNNKLITVDILNVNDYDKKPWLKFKSKYSPFELISLFGFEKNVEFINDNSINFLNNCHNKFDFIFPDGSHKAAKVFQEIRLALNLLNKNGIILLHDYFHLNKPLWDNNIIIPGPYLAIEKIKSLNENIKALPLNEFPWETKLNSKYTSLAILTKSNNS